MYLWRAVDHEGEVLDMLVQRRRDTRAALRLMRKLLKKLGFAPKLLVTDKLGSYGSAFRQLRLTKVSICPDGLRRKRDWRFADSLLKGDGFELPVPDERGYGLSFVCPVMGLLFGAQLLGLEGAKRAITRTRADRNRPTLPPPRIGAAGPPHRRRSGPASQELTTATASISIMKSGPARRVTPTVVLVGVASPRYRMRMSAHF